VRAPRFVVTSLARTSSVSANISNALQEEDLNSVMYRHRFDARSGFPNVDADPDPEWHQNDPHPHADPTPRFTHMLKNPIFLYITSSHSFASLQCFNFQSNVKDVIILSILDSILKFCGKK
jgi:hypothetical protein